MLYGFVIENPNEDWVVDYAVVTVTIRGADGEVIATRDTVSSKILPGGVTVGGDEVYAWATDVNTVDFTLKTIGQDHVRKVTDADISGADKLRAVSIVEFEIDQKKVYAGEIENTGDEAVDIATYAIMLRTASGTMISAQMERVENIPAGGKVPFEMTMQAPWFDSYEIFITPGL